MGRDEVGYKIGIFISSCLFTIHSIASNARTVLHECGRDDDYTGGGTASGGVPAVDASFSKSVAHDENGTRGEDKPAPHGTDSARVHHDAEKERETEESGVDGRPKHGSRLRHYKER